MHDIPIEVFIWLIAAAVFVIMEFISMGLTTIWFAGGAVVAAIASVFGAPVWLEILLFIIVTVILFVFTRPIALKHLNTKTEKTNVEKLIGETAIITSDIDNVEGTGQAKVDGMEWTARSIDPNEKIPKGTIVVIREVQGVKLIVEKEK